MRNAFESSHRFEIIVVSPLQRSDVNSNLYYSLVDKNNIGKHDPIAWADLDCNVFRNNTRDIYTWDIHDVVSFSLHAIYAQFS